jgi:hypothetical protein
MKKLMIPVIVLCIVSTLSIYWMLSHNQMESISTSPPANISASRPDESIPETKPKIKQGTDVISFEKEKSNSHKIVDAQESASNPTIVKGALPPALKAIENELKALDKEMQRKETELISESAGYLSGAAETDNLIAETDRLIAQINENEGIDGAAIEAERLRKIQEAVATPSPKAEKLESKMSRIEDEISKIEEKLSLLN